MLIVATLKDLFSAPATLAFLEMVLYVKVRFSCKNEIILVFHLFKSANKDYFKTNLESHTHLNKHAMVSSVSIIDHFCYYKSCLASIKKRTTCTTYSNNKLAINCSRITSLLYSPQLCFASIILSSEGALFSGAVVLNA